MNLRRHFSRAQVFISSAEGRASSYAFPRDYANATPPGKMRKVVVEEVEAEMDELLSSSPPRDFERDELALLEHVAGQARAELARRGLDAHGRQLDAGDSSDGVSMEAVE